MRSPAALDDQLAVFFYAKKFLTGVLVPPTSLLLLVLAGLLMASAGARRRLGLALAWLGTLALLALSTPFVADQLTRMVADAPVLDPARLQWAQAIVILGGGLRRNAVEYGTDVPTSLTMARIAYGAALARRSGLPVLVTGGRVFGVGRAEADVMREVLERDFRVPVRWLEEQSRNTRENAVYSAKILKRAHIARVIVVAHAVDARRARREFEAEGLEVTVAPTLIPGARAESWTEQLPNAQALSGSALAVYEMLGNVATSLGLSGG